MCNNQVVAFAAFAPQRKLGFFLLKSAGWKKRICLHFRVSHWSLKSDMRYPVDVLSCSCGYVVFCRDLPDAQAHGETRDQAIDACKEALIAAFEGFFADREAIPVPSEPDNEFIIVPASVAGKVLLLNEVIHQGVSNTELAKMMGLPRQEITRIFNLSHSTKIDTIQKALAVLGKQLTIRVL